MTRLYSFALSCFLLAPACGGSGGGTDTDDSTPGTDPGTTSTDGASSTTLDATGTTTDEPNPTGTTTLDPDTTTDTEPGTTTGEPSLCAGLAVPEPPNMVELESLDFYTEDESFNLVFLNTDLFALSFDLGPAEPVVGVLTEVQYDGDQWLGEQSIGANGTATIELLEVTADCVLGRISDVVPLNADNDWYVADALPGGFVATRRTF